MRPVTNGMMLVALAVFMVACARPIKLKLDTSSLHPAAATFALKQGTTAAIPEQCQTPCEVEIAPDTAHEVTLRAPGQYPAVLQLTYELLQRNVGATGEDEANLRVPLRPRPLTVSAPQASQTLR